jgi:trans-2-enoyl-CoA reductase
MQAEGTYGTKAQLPAVGGNEGVAMVDRVGSGVQTLKVGDWVIPTRPPFGTWTQEAKADEGVLVKIPNDLPAAYAATISANPASAYRMLRDFENLVPGDVIIQNGANSMVGLAVVQMAKLMGVRTINIVRADRPEVGDALRLLTNLGGDINITDSYLKSGKFHEVVADLPPIKLALNCVGGDNATDMARVLGAGGTMVTYGGMSKRPLALPFELLAYKQLKMKGFWISKWYETCTAVERESMLEEIAQQIRSQQLTFLFRTHDLDDFPYALKKATEPFQTRKVVLSCNFPDRMAEHDARDPEDYWIFEAPVV